MEKEKDKYKEGEEYLLEDIKGNIGGKSFQGVPLQRVKQFTVPLAYSSNRKIAKCQIKGCYETGSWLVGYKGKTILLCFSHGEEV